MKTIYAIQVNWFDKENGKWVFNESNVSQEAYDTYDEAYKFMRERSDNISTTSDVRHEWIGTKNYGGVKLCELKIKELQVREGR